MIGSVQAKSSRVSTAARAAKTANVVLTAADIPFLFPAPTLRPIRTVEPMAKPAITTVSMCISWLPTDTAVIEDASLNCPTMNRSAIP